MLGLSTQLKTLNAYEMFGGERELQRDMNWVMRKWSCSEPLWMIWVWTCSRLRVFLQAFNIDRIGIEEEEDDCSKRVVHRLIKLYIWICMEV